MKLDLAPDAAATIFNTLGVRRCLAIPFSPWSKPMEAAFSAMAQDENLLCGYCGRNAAAKPEILKALAAKGQLLTLAQYAAWYAAWAAERNASHVLGHLRDHPPMHYYQGIQLRLVDPALLDTLLDRATDRVLGNHGIDLPGLGRFMSEDPALIWLIGQKVEVRYSHDDPSAIRVYHKASGTRFVLPRIPEGNDWAMILGGQPSPQFEHAQRVRSTQQELIAAAAEDVARTANPRYLDRTGTYAQASLNRRQIETIQNDIRDKAITVFAARGLRRPAPALPAPSVICNSESGMPASGTDPLDAMLAAAGRAESVRLAALETQGAPADGPVR
jgi:hypothetical protein